MMAMKDPAAFCELLKSENGYKLKGDGDLKYQLGCDFGQDPDGFYYYGPFKFCALPWKRSQTVLSKP